GLAAAGIDLKVLLGGEVRLHPDALDLLVADDLPVIGMIGADRLVLLEFPDGQLPAGAEVACRYFADRGLARLLAHPGRHQEVMRDPQRIQPFVDSGCLLQVTAASVVGRFGPQALQAAHQLLAKGLVAVVATDSHNLLHRPPILNEAREAIAKLYGSGLAHRLTEETPAAIIADRVRSDI